MNDTTELQVIPNNALEAITRGEIDTQIRTAKAYPRSMKKFLSTAIDQATAHVEIAESFIYVRPVGMKNGKMQYAEGLSVRAAEIVGAAYGNLRVGSMIIEQTDRYVVTRGFAHDLESNFASTSENKEPTVTKDGKPFSEGMRAVIAKASLAKARRDATFQVVPKALCRPIETAARALIAGDSKSLESRRANAVQFVQRLNIDPARVWAAMGVAGEEELTSDHLLTLAGIRTAIKDGDTKIEDAFPDANAAKPRVGAPPVTKNKEPAKEPAKEPVKAPETPAEQPPAKPEPEAQSQEGDPQPEPTPEPVEIPEDPAALLLLAKDTLARADIEEKDALNALKKMRKCGAVCAQLADVAKSGLTFVVRNTPEIVAWLDKNRE